MAPVEYSEEGLTAFLRRLDGVAYSTYALVMLLVPLKLWCRRRTGGWSNIGLDDLMTVLALLVANGFFWTAMHYTRPMIGRHVASFPNPIATLTDFLRYIWIGQVFYTFSITVTKFTVLAFYWRLFSVKARTSIWILAGACTAWFIAMFMCFMFSCIPLKASWDVTITDAKCIPIRSIYLGGSIPNVVIDALVVAMPLPYVWRLHASLAQRLVLAGMFALGTFIAVVSLIRLIIFLQIPIATSGDATYNFRDIVLWSIIEVNVGLACACLPSLKPAFALVGLNRLFTFTTSRNSNDKSTGPSSAYPSERYGSTGDSRRSRPRKKGATGGMFSSIGGLTRLDSEEELKIVDEGHGQNHTDVEMMRFSEDGGRKSSPKATPSNGIAVQKGWSVFVDKDSNR